MATRTNTTNGELNMTLQTIKNSIRNIPDYPKPGIQFKDITTALKDAETLKLTIDEIYENFNRCRRSS